MSDEHLPDAVERWETSGGTWRVVSVQGTHMQGSIRQGASATVELLRCDGGEVIERVTLQEAQDLAWAKLQLGELDIDHEGLPHE